MGWLGWTEAEAMATDVNSIQLAIEGLRESREEFLRAIYAAGGIKLPPPKPKTRPPIDHQLKMFAAEHNARLRAERGGTRRRAGQKRGDTTTLPPAAEPAKEGGGA